MGPEIQAGGKQSRSQLSSDSCSPGRAKTIVKLTPILSPIARSHRRPKTQASAD
jgi:hypothetical protein